MKKYIITILMAVVAIVSVSAQQKLVLQLEDGTTKEYETWEVVSLDFAPSATVTSTAPSNYVDLGFAKWAPYNLGAASATDAGWLVGWGDATGTNKSTRLNFFPAKEYTEDIYETPYDIAHTMWGSEWRLPTASDIQLLRDSCTWEYAVVNEVPGWKLTSKKEGYTEASIFLPFTGYRNGKNNAADADKKGLYWTGEISTNTTKAKALLFTEHDTLRVDSLRNLGFAIRPVFGRFVHALAMKVGEATNIGTNSVTIPAELTGDATAMAKITQIGVCYGLESESVDPTDPNVAHKEIRNYESGKTQLTISIDGLAVNTTYQAVVYLILQDGTTIMGTPNTVQFTTLAKFHAPTEGVRLGSMNIEWAPFNLGESTEWGNTHLYGWGDADGDLRSTNYQDYAVGLPTTVTNISGNPAYDIAAKQWGNGWRLPTLEEFNLLYNTPGVSLTKETNGSKVGYRFTDTSTGKSILIPAGGGRFGNGIQFPESYYYWTANATWNSTDGWKGLVAYLSLTGLNKISGEYPAYPKFWGMGIRPVRTIGGGDTNGTGTTGNNLTTEGKKVNFVDLGLSILWADRNVGAAKETDYGDYFAWGDIEARTSDFNKEHYQYFTNSTYEKIGTSSSQFVLNPNSEWLISGDERYDAARYRWGGNCCMPTILQIDELKEYCKWERVTNYKNSGHNGYKVTGPSGNSIFLPAAGGYFNSSLNYEGEQGIYWSGALNTGAHTGPNSVAWTISFYGNQSDGYQVDRAYKTRVSGYSIRPVRKGQN